MATGVNNINTRVYATSWPSVPFSDEAMTDAGDHQNYKITNQLHRMLDPNTAVVVQEAHDEIQSVTVTAGSFTLTFGASTTGSLSNTSTASAVQAALQGLASVGAGNALVTGSTGGPFTVQFTATKGQASQSLMTSTGATIARVQAGSAFATIASGFVLYLVGARVVFTVAQAVGSYVRLHSGSYLPYLAILGADTAEYNAQNNSQETTDFIDGGWKAYTLTTTEGTLKCHAWWQNSAIIQNLINRDLLAISYFDGDNYNEGYCWVSDSDLKSATKGVVETDYTFQLTDQFFVN